MLPKLSGDDSSVQRLRGNCNLTMACMRPLLAAPQVKRYCEKTEGRFTTVQSRGRMSALGRMPTVANGPSPRPLRLCRESTALCMQYTIGHYTGER